MKPAFADFLFGRDERRALIPVLIKHIDQRQRQYIINLSFNQRAVCFRTAGIGNRHARLGQINVINVKGNGRMRPVIRIDIIFIVRGQNGAARQYGAVLRLIRIDIFTDKPLANSIEDLVGHQAVFIIFLFFDKRGGISITVVPDTDKAVAVGMRGNDMTVRLFAGKDQQVFLQRGLNTEGGKILRQIA